MGSALTQAVNSLPTRIFKGDEAADKFMQERMYQPTQPTAYEYAGDIGDFLEKLETQYKIPPILPEAVALQYLSGPATAQAARAAGKGAVKAGMALERSMEPVVRGALEQGGLPREMALGMGANTQSNVMKTKENSNWLKGSPDRSLENLKQYRGPDNREAELLAEIEEATRMGAQGYLDAATADLKRYRESKALDAWVDSNLKNYVKKQMGTPEDPVRALHEQGISHLPEDLQNPEMMWTPEELARDRKMQGFPEEGVAISPTAQMWEQMSDQAIIPTRAGDIQQYPAQMEKRAEALAKYHDYERQLDDKLVSFLHSKGFDSDQIVGLLKMPASEKANILGDKKLGKLFREVPPYPANEQFMRESSTQNPWLSKVDPNTPVYSGDISGLGFDHVLDVLREDIAAGRIRPEQLNKVSMEQAVRRTFEYDQELARKMNEARNTARADLPVYKDYPEGFKWVELNKPGSFAAESKAMGHSVKGYEPPEGHPDWTEGSGDSGSLGYGHGGWEAIKSGKAKVYSLVDAKGEPHTTIEVSRGEHPIGYSFKGAGTEFPDTFEYNRNFEEEFPRPTPEQKQTILKRAAELRSENPRRERMDAFQSAADEVLGPLPARITQIKGKQNAKPKDDYLPFVQDFVKGGNWSDIGDFRNTGLIREGGQLMTPAEHADYLLKELGADTYNELGLGATPPAAGMKRGGKVSISNNPDTMMLELGNKRMKEGGSEDNTKPFFGGAGTKKYAAAKKRAEQGDVNTLQDPRTYAAVAGFFGERPDEMGFSVMHPDYQGVREAADPAFYAGTALGVAPLMKVFKAPAMALGRAGERYAEKVVPQIMERGGVGADMLGGLAQGTRSYAHLPHTEKSPDPTVGTRYKRTDIGGLVPRKDLDIEKLDKSSVKVFPWDASDRNKLVTEVSDIPLTNPVLLEGGDNYMRDLKHVKKRIAGASNEGIANRIQDRIDQASVENQILGGTGKVFGFPIRMADKAEHASTFPTDIAMDLLKQGNLSRKELDDLTNELRGMSFEAKGKGYFQNVAPIDSPEFLVQLREGIKGNKEKGITSVTDMNLRRALMDRLSQKKFQKRLEYNYPDLIGSVIADELKGVPKGWVGNVSAELDPFSKIRPSKSSTYSHDFGGKYYASMPNMPVEFLTPNTYEGIYREMKSLYPSAKPEALRNMTIGAMEKRKEKISEMIGPRSIDAVKLYQEGLKQGEFDPNDIKQIYDYMRRKKFQLKLKDGGTVKKPAGAVKQPAAYIDGSEFVEAAQKYGIKDSMSNLNMIVNLVNKGLSVDDAARQVSDSGMHKAAGGAVSGDDLILEERPL
jgi:hypothetical protein